MRRCIFSSTATFLQTFPADWSARRRGRRGRGPPHRTRDGGNAQEDTGGEDECTRKVAVESCLGAFFQDSKNVVGLVVVNGEGLPVTSSLDSTLTVQVRNKQIRNRKIPKKNRNRSFCAVFGPNHEPGGHRQIGRPRSGPDQRPGVFQVQKHTSRLSVFTPCHFPPLSSGSAAASTRS